LKPALVACGPPQQNVGLYVFVLVHGAQGQIDRIRELRVVLETEVF